MIKKDKIDKNSHEYKTGFRDGIEYANEKLKEDGTFFQRIYDLISYDISTIWDEQGKGQDGMYSLDQNEMFDLNVTQRGDGTIERVFRNKVKGYEEYITRIYVLVVVFVY